MIKFKLQGNGTHSWIVNGELTYESPTNKAHNDMLEAILKEHNYLSIGEVTMWVNDVDYGAEAQSIINWWISTCKLVEEYLTLNPTELTAEEFINSIPTL